VVTFISEVANMKFVGVREFKEDVVKYLNEGSEIVVMKRKRPIARLTPVEKIARRSSFWKLEGF